MVLIDNINRLSGIRAQDLVRVIRCCNVPKWLRRCDECPMRTASECPSDSELLDVAADKLEYYISLFEKRFGETKAEGEWISVKERLPETYDEYGIGEYVLATDGVVTTRAFYGYPGDHDEWFINPGEQWEATFDRPVTHWMPLPKAPEEGER